MCRDLRGLHHLSHPAFTDVPVLHAAVCIIPQPAFALCRAMKLAAVLSVLSEGPVVRLTVIPVTAHRIGRRDNHISHSYNLPPRALVCAFHFRSFMFVLRWGWAVVSPIHPGPVSLLLSLHKSNPDGISGFNNWWYVVLQEQKKRYH